MCRADVCLDGCGRLFVAHLFKELLHGDYFTGIDVEGTKLSFGCAGHDNLEDFGDVEDCSITGWFVDVRRAEEMSTGAALCSWFA